MNHIYRLVWSRFSRAWIPVAENTKTHGKSGGRKTAARRRGGRALVAALLAVPAVALAKTVAPDATPTGFKVLGGSGSASQTGSDYTVDQTSMRAAFGFDSLDVGVNASFHLKQMSGAIGLLLVGGTDPSYIHGKFTADSQVFIANPYGVVFGAGASVNVGGMLATTMSIAPNDFMNGNYRLSNPGSGAVRNEGLINAVGSVALVGKTVENAGKIVATTVTLAAGDTVAVALTGDGLIRARVEDPALKAGIVNSGNINATVGVVLSAGQARDTLDRVVNNSGIIRATGLAAQGGEIVLEGGLVANSGTLDVSNAVGKGGNASLLGRNVALASSSVIDASGATSGGTVKVMGDMTNGRVDVDGRIYARGDSGDGGFVETSAAEVGVAKGFRINALSAHGRNGRWLIDPLDFYITAGGGAQTSSGIGADTLSSNLGGADVTIVTDNVNNAAGNYGDIYVNSAVAWSAATTLTLNAYRHINVNAAIATTGGSVKLRADATGTGTGTVAFGAGGSVATTGSGRTDIYYNPVALPAASVFGKYAGADKSDSGGNPYSGKVTGTYTAWMLVNTVNDIFTTSGYGNINDNLDGNYALGKNINFAGIYYGYGFRPIGSYSLYTPFTGKFDGRGHTISNLTITGCSGLMTSPCIGYSNYVGLFAHTSSTAIIQNLGLLNVTVNTDANGVASSNVGTLVGSNSGQIINSYAEGTIGSNAYTPRGSSVGGLVGSNNGTISRSYAAVIIYGSGYTGGLVGDNSGTVSNSYASGSVYGAYLYTGGLVGYNGSYGTVADAYATGAVGNASGSSLGGLVGRNNGTVQNSFWNTESSCVTAHCAMAVIGSAGAGATASGVTGLANADMKTKANFANAGWSIADAGGSSATWRIYEGHTYPLLRALLTPLTITADNVTKTADGTAYTDGLTNPSYSISGADSSGLLLGTGDTYGSPSAVGSYAPQLYSNQGGYDISYVGGTLTISAVAALAASPDVASAPAEKNSSSTTTAVTEVTAVTVQSAGTDGSSSSADAGGNGTPATTPTSQTVASANAPKADEPVVRLERPKGRALTCRQGA